MATANVHILQIVAAFSTSSEFDNRSGNTNRGGLMGRTVGGFPTTALGRLIFCEKKKSNPRGWFEEHKVLYLWSPLSMPECRTVQLDVT